MLVAWVCKKFKDATAHHTLVPLTNTTNMDYPGRNNPVPEIYIRSPGDYRALTLWMPRALPNLLQMHVGKATYDRSLHFEEGDDPEPDSYS